MMRLPLYMTYSTDTEPYLGYARRLESQVRDLRAGHFHHALIVRQGNGMDFFADVQGVLYRTLTEWIDSAPVIFLDCDLELRKPIVGLFEGAWDVAAVYRGHLFRNNMSGRQDYSSAFVAMNCRRPNAIRRFWLEWTSRIISWPVCYPDKVPAALIKRGWLASWFSDQSALNDILLPNGPEKKVPGFMAYHSQGYMVLPLKAEEYTAESTFPEIKDPYIFHQKPPRGRSNVV
jgi:hypothetical protein